MNLRISGLIAALLLSATTIQAEEWPGWRGPRGDGASAEAGVADAWGPKENVRWKALIPGVGHSSPIVWGGRVFLTTCGNEGQNLGDRKVLCLDRVSGAILWDNTVVKAKLEHKHGTPATGVVPHDADRPVGAAGAELQEQAARREGVHVAGGGFADQGAGGGVRRQR